MDFQSCLEYEVLILEKSMLSLSALGWEEETSGWLHLLVNIPGSSTLLSVYWVTCCPIHVSWDKAKIIKIDSTEFCF